LILLLKKAKLTLLYPDNTMKNFKYYLLFYLFLGLAATSNAQSITWTEVEPGIWKGVVGKSEEFDLLKASGAQPYHAGLQQTPAAGFPLSQQEITAGYRMVKRISGFLLKKRSNNLGLV
jgi:hypothetical protein